MGLSCVPHDTFLELGNGTTALSRGMCGGYGYVALSPAFARRSPKSCAAAGPVARCGSMLSVVGQCLYAQHRSHTVIGYVESDRGDKTPRSMRVPRAAFTLEPPSPKNTLQPNGVYNGEGAMQQPPPWTSTIYYDDVSSGPRPKAHWYMLTHPCYSDTAPYWTPHRTAPSSVPPLHLYCA